MQGVILEAYQTAVTVWIVLIQFNELFNRLKLKMDYKELGHMSNEMEQIKIMSQSNHYNTNQLASKPL
jgi:hypothetical protein